MTTPDVTKIENWVEFFIRVIPSQFSDIIFNIFSFIESIEHVKIPHYRIDSCGSHITIGFRLLVSSEKQGKIIVLIKNKLDSENILSFMDPTKEEAIKYKIGFRWKDRSDPKYWTYHKCVILNEISSLCMKVKELDLFWNKVEWTHHTANMFGLLDNGYSDLAPEKHP